MLPRGKQNRTLSCSFDVALTVDIVPVAVDIDVAVTCVSFALISSTFRLRTETKPFICFLAEES